MAVTRRIAIAALAAAGAGVVAAALVERPGAGVEGRLRRAAAPLADRLIVIGDSYSSTRSKLHTYAKWPTQLVAKGYARSIVDLARGGTTAADLGRPGRSDVCFRQAVDRWVAMGEPWGERDATVVYLGHLDLVAYRRPGYETLERSRADYVRELDRLIAVGATGGHRRIVLVRSHDRGWNRSDRPMIRQRTLDWNEWLADVAQARPGVVTADVFSVVDRLLEDPAAFGIDELRQPDQERSATTSLMFDNSHFGGRGQEVIASAVAVALREPVARGAT